MKEIVEVRVTEPVPFHGMRILFRPNVPEGLTIERNGGPGDPVTISWCGEHFDLYPPLIAYVRWKESVRAKA